MIFEPGQTVEIISPACKNKYGRSIYCDAIVIGNLVDVFHDPRRGPNDEYAKKMYCVLLLNPYGNNPDEKLTWAWIDTNYSSNAMQVTCRNTRRGLTIILQPDIVSSVITTFGTNNGQRITLNNYFAKLTKILATLPQ
jgi:hypothetical protein